MTHAALSALLLDYLKAHARGRANAVPRDEALAHIQLFEPDLRDREFREIYSNAGLPACEAGIFYPTTPQDIKAFEEYMKKKALPCFDRIKRVRRAFPHLVEDGAVQMELEMP